MKRKKRIVCKLYLNGVDFFLMKRKKEGREGRKREKKEGRKRGR
jgi:hypothetical protein